jgi:hypothetical protein
MNLKIFRRDSGRAEVAPHGNMTLVDRGSADITSSPSRDSAAVPRTARSAAALSWLSAARSIITAPLAFARKFFGLEADDFLFVIGRRRGYRPNCELCEDVHDIGEQCPRLLVADCPVCLRVVQLDRFGHCVRGGRNHAVANRRAAPKRYLRVVGGAR